MAEVIINDSNWKQFVNPVVAGEKKSTGLIPRDYQRWPLGCYKNVKDFRAVDMPVIPRSEWSARIKEKIATKSQMSDIRLTGNGGGVIPSLDQNGRGYCWMHSGTGAVMMLRAVNNEPYVGLSAYACACVIKNYADEGGWGAQGVDFLTDRGVPSEKFWPMRSIDSTNDNAATWQNAALHKVSAGWIDLQAAQYDRQLSFDQVATCLLINIPVVGDFNWWSHSVCLLDLVEVSSGSFGVRILNSWGDSWSDRGMGVLEGDKAIPDGAVAPRVVTVSPA